MFWKFCSFWGSDKGWYGSAIHADIFDCRWSARSNPPRLDSRAVCRSAVTADRVSVVSLFEASNFAVTAVSHSWRRSWSIVLVETRSAKRADVFRGRRASGANPARLDCSSVCRSAVAAGRVSVVSLFCSELEAVSALRDAGGEWRTASHVASLAVDDDLVRRRGCVSCEGEVVCRNSLVGDGGSVPKEFTFSISTPVSKIDYYWIFFECI